jgi:prevent-host-death family protein
MEKIVTIYDAKTNLSKYINIAKQGQPVYIGSFGKREVVLKAASAKKSKIVYGLSAGKFKYQDECVLEGKDNDIQKMFYGN